MKKTSHILATFFLGVLGLVFFVPLSAKAQQFFPDPSGIVVIGQGQIAATSTMYNNGNSAGNSIFLGTGYSGTTTGAVLSYKTVGQTNQNPTVAVAYTQYSDAAYSSSVGTCSYESTQSGDNDGVVQLSYHASTGVGCELHPENYVRVNLGWDAGTGQWGVTMKYVYGSATNSHGWTYCKASDGSPSCSGGTNLSTDFFPYWSLLGGDFVLTPTVADSGVSLSGALAFCNDALASTTGIGATIANGLCVSFGFLFIPTQASVSQYGDIPEAMSAVVPFSYFFDVKDALGGLTASTTQNLPTYSIDLSVLDAASSTAMGRILPTGNFSFFSTTTINRYLPAGMHDLLYFLMQSAIWVGLAFMLYHKVVPKKASI